MYEEKMKGTDTGRWICLCFKTWVSNSGANAVAILEQRLHQVRGYEASATGYTVLWHLRMCVDGCCVQWKSLYSGQA